MQRFTSLLTTCLCFVTLLSIVNLHGQTQTDPAASALISKALQEFSSVAVHSVQIAGTATGVAGSTHETGSFTLKGQATGESTLTLNLGSLSRTEGAGAFSSVRQYQWTGSNGVQHDTALQNCVLPVNWAVPLLDLETQAPKLNQSVSSGTDQGVSVQALSLSFPPINGSASTQKLAQLSEAKLSFDATTINPTSLSFNIHPDNDENTDIPIVVRYSDYRQVSGASIPFHIQKYLNDSLVLDLQVETAEVQ